MNPIILNFIISGEFSDFYYVNALISQEVVENLSVRPLQIKDQVLGAVIDEDVFPEIYKLAYNHPQIRSWRSIFTSPNWG